MPRTNEQSESEPDLTKPDVHDALDRYWRTNTLIMRVLLGIWAIVGLGCGVLFADWLNQFKIGGFPLGFWFAQQGSIVVFVLLILTYALLMNWLDAKHHKEIIALTQSSGAAIETSPSSTPPTAHSPADPDQEAGSA